MSRRTTPQHRTDDVASPVRVKIAVPPTGLGEDLTRIILWMRENFERGDWAEHSAQTIGGSAMALYFRGPVDAVRFRLAFPHLPLADGTMRRSYRSPALPSGRRDD